MSLANKINQRTVICLFVICGVIATNTPKTTFFDTIMSLIIPKATGSGLSMPHLREQSCPVNICSLVPINFINR